MDFGEFYAKSEIALICEAIDKLFRDTCDNWYASRGELQLLDLTEDYQRVFNYPTDTLAQAIFPQMSVAQAQEKLYFLTASAQTIAPSPTRWAIAGKALSRATYKCITHGDFHHHNMFVDSTGHIWLIDLQETARSHILRDFAILDLVVRFQLLTADQATLEERFAWKKRCAASITSAR